MAKATRTTIRKNTRRRTAPARGAKTALARLSGELQPTLRQFTRRLRPGLARLERQVEVAEARTRREAARLLRRASEELGRLEAKGEQRWRHLTERARRDAVRWLHRVERAIEKGGPRRGRTRARASRTKLDLAAGI
jgi:hypothetical protein